MSVSGNIEDTKVIFLSMLTLGLIGILFLIVFGNLSGNLGFASTTTSFLNESTNGTIAYALNDTTILIAGQSTAGFQSLAVTSVVNSTSGSVINVGNYTVDGTLGTIVGSVGRTDNWTVVNLTYTVTHQGIAERNSESVITNLTGGATTFFSFSNVWFTLLAVTLLIIIVVGVIGVVNKQSKSKFTS